MIALYSFGCYTELANDVTMYKLFEDLLSRGNNILISRLYKKYLDINDAYSVIKLLKTYIPNCKDSNKRLLSSIISACEDGVEGSELALKNFGEYEPLRLVILDEPFCTISDNIPLEDYDNNDGEPFWMRPGYILEHYSKSNKK